MFAQIFRDFVMVFRDFSHFSTNFVQILEDFARIFTKSKLLGVRFYPCTPASYTGAFVDVSAQLGEWHSMLSRNQTRAYNIYLASTSLEIGVLTWSSVVPML